MKSFSLKLPASPVAILKNMGILAPVVLAIAVGATVAAGMQLGHVMHSLPSSAPAKVGTIDKQYLKAQDYKAIADRMTLLNPSVKVEASKQGDSLEVSTLQPEAYNPWLFALYGLQAMEKDLIWEASELCLNQCANSTAQRAVVKAYRQKVTIQ